MLYQMHFHNTFKERGDTVFVIKKCHSQIWLQNLWIKGEK